MAGNHVHDHVVKRRVLAILLAAVTAWIPADIWRARRSTTSAPVRIAERGEAYAAVRQQRSASIAGLRSVPFYPWIADSQWPGIANAQGTTLRHPFALVAPPSESPWMLEIGSEGDASMLRPAELPWEKSDPIVVELIARQRPLESRGMYAQAWWQVGRWLASGHSMEEGARQEEGPRLASPPSLLGPVRVEGAHDRLAMLDPATTRRGSSDLAIAEGFSENLWKHAQPMLAHRLDMETRRSIYPAPAALVELLQELMLELELTDWASQTLSVLSQLTSNDLGQVEWGIVRPRSEDLIESLASLSQRAEELAQRATDPGVATRLRRARHAMWRRVQCWNAAGDAITPLATRFVLASTRSPASTSTFSNRESEIEELLKIVEQYEAKGGRRSEQLIAQRIALLATSDDEREQALGQSLDLHYRNANVRVALSQEFLNRLMPHDERRDVPVRDRILGTPVRGIAETVTSGEVELIPDPEAWRVVLQVRGQAAARTVARQRSVRVVTVGDTDFVANQQIVLDESGLRVGEARANAISSSQFVRAASQLDAVPLVGSLVRSKAKDEFLDRRGAANRQVASKAEAQSCRELELKVGESLAKAEATFQEKIALPLSNANVTLEPIEMVTTPERLVSRLRISREGSLGAFTPRPRAPSDSLASLQIHQSALTSLAATLRLDGERLTAAQLTERLEETYQRKGSMVSEIDAQEVLLEFAPDEALSVALADGRLHLTLSLRELVIRNRKIRDFKIHTYYVPQIEGLQAKFQHAEGPYFEGPIRNSERMTLHAAFAPVLGSGSGWTVGESLHSDPRMEGLMITQFVIDDGWLGLALGPASVERTAQLDRYEWIR